MVTVGQDIRFALRSMRKTPGFTAVAVLSLALGIGATTAIFTVVNFILFHPLTVANPARLMEIFTIDESHRGERTNYLPSSYPNGDDLRRRTRSFSGVALYASTDVSMTINGTPERLTADLVSGNFFEVLGIQPTFGRAFTAEDDIKPGASPFVVLTYGMWERKFGSNRQVVGQTVLLNGQPFTIAGVAPQSFQGTAVLRGPDMWIPLSMHDQVFSGPVKTFFNERRFLDFSMVARLKDDVQIEQAHSELRTIGADLEREFPLPNKNRTFAMLPLLESNIDPNLRGLFNRAGGLLMAVVGLVLLIACANIANLLLVRAAGRRREVSIRLALGAARRHIITQLLTEAILLGLIGGAVGLVLAVIGCDLLWNFRPPMLQQSHLNLGIDGKVLLFNLLISLAAGIICGLAPALQSTRPDLVSELKERAGGGDSAGRRFSLYHVAIAVEVTFCMICLVGAGLFLRSLSNAQRIDTGFDTHNLAMLTFDVGSLNYDPQRVLSFQQRVLEAARAVPGVTSATLSADIPLFGDPSGRTVLPEGEQGASERNGIVVLWTSIGDDYLRTMGIPLARGQDLDSSVRQDSRKVAIINESAARRFWPNTDPVGRRIKFYTGEEVNVIGVAHDSKYATLGESPTPYMYLPLVQSPSPQATLFIRSSANPAAVISSVRSQIQALDHNLPLTNVWSIGEVISQQLWAANFAAKFLSLFAVVALTLCAIGINGTVGYTVSRRVREIGLRLALGAQPGNVLLMILKQSATVLLIGLTIGVICSLILTTLVVSLLYGVNAHEPLTLLGAVLGLILVGLAASYFPARRAARVDPMVALHSE